MSDFLIISLVIVFGPMLCLLGLAMCTPSLADDRRVTRPDPSADEWRFPRRCLAHPRPSTEVPRCVVAEVGSGRGQGGVGRPR